MRDTDASGATRVFEWTSQGGLRHNQLQEPDEASTLPMQSCHGVLLGSTCCSEETCGTPNAAIQSEHAHHKPVEFGLRRVPLFLSRRMRPAYTLWQRRGAHLYLR